MAAVAPALGVPYEARPVRFLRRERCGAWRLKLYGIALPGREPRPEFVDAVMELAPDVLPAPAQTEDRYGVGFVTAHDSAIGGLALYYWWENANECHYRVYGSPHREPGALVKIEDPGVGCVWELEIVDFERRVWLEDVLANPDGPDFDRYLSRRFSVDL